MKLISSKAVNTIRTIGCAPPHAQPHESSPVLQDKVRMPSVTHDASSDGLSPDFTWQPQCLQASQLFVSSGGSGVMNAEHASASLISTILPCFRIA